MTTCHLPFGLPEHLGAFVASGTQSPFPVDCTRSPLAKTEPPTSRSPSAAAAANMALKAGVATPTQVQAASQRTVGYGWGSSLASCTPAAARAAGRSLTTPPRYRTPPLANCCLQRAFGSAIPRSRSVRVAAANVQQQAAAAGTAEARAQTCARSWVFGCHCGACACVGCKRRLADRLHGVIDANAAETSRRQLLQLGAAVLSTGLLPAAAQAAKGVCARAASRDDVLCCGVPLP